MNFTAILFIIAPNWKQPKCHSMGEWLTKLWYTHTMEHSLAKKKNKETIMDTHTLGGSHL